jgi:pentatricopeptide repeat protein
MRRIQTLERADEEDPQFRTMESSDRKGKGKAITKGGAETTEGNFATSEKKEESDVTNSKNTKEQNHYSDPEVRQRLNQLITNLPPKPTREQLLEIRTQIRDHDLLDDTRLIRRVSSIAMEQKFFDIALRLLNQSVNLILKRRKALWMDASWMYIEAIQHLVRLKSWDHVVELSNQVITKGLASPAVLQNRMRALNRRSRFVEAIATFDLYDKYKLDPDGKAYDEVIEAHLQNADLPKAQELLAAKGEKGFPTTVQTCLTLFDGMALYGGNKVMEEKVLEDASEEMLESKGAMRQEVRVLNKIMSVRAGRDAARDALAMLDYYNLERYPPELIDKFRQLVLPFDNMTSTTRQYDHWKPSPDRATLVTLVGLALRYRRPDLASQLLSSTTARSYPLNDHIASSIIRILVTEGSISAAEEFVFDLPLGRAHFRNKPYRSYQPGSFVYETLLTGILRFRGLAGVNECFRRLMEAKLPPLKVTEGLTRALVDYLAVEKIFKLGLSTNLLVKVKEITAGRTKPTRENLNTLLKAAWMSERLSIHEWTNKRKTIENEFPIPADDGRPKPPPRPLPRIAQILARQNFPSKQSRIINSLTAVRDSLIDRNVRHNAETAVQVLRNDHLIRFISAKWDYLQAQILDLGVRPTYDHFTVLIRAYLILGDVKGAVLALRYALSEARIDPHVALYSTMISGLSRLGRHEIALTMYEELRNTPGIEPDRQLFVALAMSCSRMRDLEGLERIFNEVRNLVDKPLPGKPIDPALLDQVRIQAQARTRRKAEDAMTGTKQTEEASRTLSYDPLLDPYFITIYYRTLNSLGRHHDAQLAMKRSLDRGLVPDQIVWQVLDRTGVWLQWKDNKNHRDRVHVDRSKTKELWEKNFRKVRKLVKESRPKDKKGELRAIERYWEKAERGDVNEKEWANFFRDTSNRRKRENDEGI